MQLLQLRHRDSLVDLTLPRTGGGWLHSAKANVPEGVEQSSDSLTKIVRIDITVVAQQMLGICELERTRHHRQRCCFAFQKVKAEVDHEPSSSAAVTVS